MRQLPRFRHLCSAAVAVALVATAAVSTPGAGAAKQRQGDRVAGSFIVDLAKGVSTAEAPRIARAYGGKAVEVYEGIRSFAFQGPDAAGSRLARDRRVSAVESDRLVEATRGTSFLSRTHADDARTAGYQGAGVRIAIIDTGVTKGHRTFDSGQVVKGKSCVGGSTRDQEGHGTASAGNAAGKVGIARSATIVPVKVFRGASLFTPISKVICGLNWVKKQNQATPGLIDVVNMSLAYSGGSNALRRAVNNVRATGAVVVAAAGNNGGGTMAPAKFGGVIAVTALAGGRRMASFSANGGSLTAPGVNIKSAENGGGYSLRSGTSRSAPMVAGAAAIVIAAAGAPLTAAQVLDILQTSGTCPNGTQNGTPGFCGGRWKGDDRNAEPLINAACAGFWADPVGTDPINCPGS